MATLQVSLLGDFQVRYGDTPVAALSGSRLLSLLAYLLLHRQSPQHRQRLAFLFWPDSTEAQARTNLRRCLLLLRQALPDADAFLSFEGQTVQWRGDAPLVLDVAEFEAAIAEAETAPAASAAMRLALERAVALYRGDLLEGCYDDWLMAERDRLGQVVIAALERLVGLLEGQREYAAAIEHAQRLLRHDPTREATYRSLMRLYALSGNRASALRVYHSCAVTLQEHLSVDPSRATRQLYEELLQVDPAPSPPRQAAPRSLPLVGRRQEWASLRAAWERVRTAGPQWVMISGEAGIGKTRLAEELIDWVTRQGLRAAVAHCYGVAGALPYAPVVALLRTEAVHRGLASLDAVWATEVARLLPELLVERDNLARPAPLGDGAQRQRLFEALARAVLQPASPLLLVMDDLHWCDAETLEWLHYLLRFEPRAPLLVVGTARMEEVEETHPLTAFWLATERDLPCISLPLTRLGPSETASLVAQMAGKTLPDQAVARLYDETEGNPLFVVEAVRAGLYSTPVQSHQSTRATSPTPDPLPARVQAVIQRRLVQLSPAARDLAALAAVVGREFAFEVLVQASDADEDTLLSGLDELWRRRIVRERAPQRRGSTDLYDFSHHKIREVVYSGLSPTRRRRLHARVAAALERVYASSTDTASAQIAAQYEQAGRPLQAIPYYQQAADVAQHMFATEEAIRYLRRALGLLATSTPTGDSQWVRAALSAVHERLGTLLHLVGDYASARDAYTCAIEAVRPSDGVRQARLRWKIGNTWREQYQYQSALQEYAAAELSLGPAPATQPSPDGTGDRAMAEWWQEWIQIRHERTTIHYWLGEVDQALALLDTLQPQVAVYGTARQHMRFLQLRATIQLRQSHFTVSDAVAADMRAAVALAQDPSCAADEPGIQFGAGFFLLWYGAFAEAEALMLAALARARPASDISLQARCLTYLTVLYRQQSRLDDVRRVLPESRLVAEAAHMPEYVATAEANQAWLAWRDGLVADVERHGQAALETWASLPSNHASAAFQWTALLPLLAAALTQGQLAQAADYGRALLQPTQQRLPARLRERLAASLAAHDTGDSLQAERLLTQTLQLAESLGYL